MKIRLFWIVPLLAIVFGLLPVRAQDAKFDQFIHQPNTFSSTQTFLNVTVTGTCTGCGGGGSVTAVSVVSANGLAGTVATPTTTPAITLSTSITGLLKGNGTAISAAVSGTDYAAPATTLAGYGITNGVTNTTTVAGHALSSNVSIACADLSNGATSCSTDTTNASNISSGTLSNARIINNKASLGITIDGAGSVISTGTKGFLYVPNACTISASTLLSTDNAVTSGSIVIDVWKVAYGSYPPTVANTITASALPTLSSATKAQDTTLTGWTTSVSAGDVLAFHVNSATTVTRVTLILSCNPS